MYVPIDSVLGAALGVVIGHFLIRILETVARARRHARLLAEREDSE